MLPARNLCNRLKVPVYFRELAELACEYHTHIHKAFELNPKTILNLFNHFDVWRKPQRFAEFLVVCEADARGRQGFEQTPYPQRKFIWILYQEALSVNVQQIIAEGYHQQGIRSELNRRRKLAIEQKRAEIRPLFSS